VADWLAERFPTPSSTADEPGQERHVEMF